MFTGLLAILFLLRLVKKAHFHAPTIHVISPQTDTTVKSSDANFSKQQ